MVVALFGLAMLMAGGPENSVSGFLALMFWIFIAPAAALIVKGLLVAVQEISSTQALLLAILSVAGAVVAVILHNLVSAIVGFEEGFFFMLALFGAPLLLVASLIRAFRPGNANHRPTASSSS